MKRLILVLFLILSITGCRDETSIIGANENGIKERDEESFSFKAPSLIPKKPLPIINSIQRHDLFFGYYGTGGNQIEETSDHVNVIMEMWFDGLETGLQRIMQSDKFTDLGATAPALIIGLHWQTYDYNTNQVRIDAEIQIRMVFEALSAIHALDRVIAVYPVDEPNLQGLNADVIKQGNALVRKVLNEYPDLSEHVKILGFYGHPNVTTEACGCELVPGMPGIESYDWVGFTYYGHPPAQIVRELKPFLNKNKKQKIVLIADGTNLTKEDPKPYLDEANKDFQIVGLIGFAWFDHNDPNRNITTGIKSSGLAPSYIEVGKAITTGLSIEERSTP